MRPSSSGGIKKYVKNHHSSRPLSGTEFFTVRDDRDEEALTESSRPEEDPVLLAFEAALDDNDQTLVDDDDEIVYPRYAFLIKHSQKYACLN
jgi:hypothetical protein